MADLKPNAELAYKVLDHIDANPEQHRQRDFVVAEGLESVTAETMDCGTTACFAGWTALLAGYEVQLGQGVGELPKVEVSGVPIDVDDFAAELLGLGTYGLDGGPAERLFYVTQDRHDLRTAVAEIFGPRPAGERDA